MTFENRVEGPLGWTNALGLDDIQALVNMGIVRHTHTLARNDVRRRVFETHGDYTVNADDGMETERITGKPGSLSPDAIDICVRLGLF